MIDLVNGKGIALMLGVRPVVVANWRTRYATFPRPINTPGVIGVPLWWRDDIIRWHRTFHNH